jgi:hypothetical protein
MRIRALAAAVAAVLLVLAVGASRPAGAADPSARPSPSGVASPWYAIAETGEPRIALYFGYSTTCPHCAKAKPWLEAFEARTPWLDVHWLRVNGDDEEAFRNASFLVGLAESIGEQVEGVPAFFFGERLRVGFDEAETTGIALEEEIAGYRAELLAELGLASPAPAVSPEPSGAPDLDPGLTVNVPLVGPIDARSLSLPLLTVVLGSLDAVNPCALSVLLFLMTVLAATRSRSRMALVGGTFVVVSGLVYFALMAAWLNIFLLAGELRIVTLAAGIAAAIAGLINIKDFAFFRRGVSLVMPESAKPMVFGRILDLGDAARVSTMVGAAILVAAAANAYEMLCTGGFPVVFTRILTLNELPMPAYYGYLALYNVVYVLPLALIVVAFTITLGSRGVSELTARRLKLLSGLLMLGLGLELIFAPELLTNLAVTTVLFGAAIGLWAIAVLVERGRATPSGGSYPARSRT